MDQGTSKTRVLIVDDHEVVRVGIRLLIDARTDLTVCGEAASAAEAISAIGQLRPDVVLLDLDLGDSHGREVLRAVTEMNERPSVVVLSMADEAVHALQSLRGGAVGYVMKDTPPEQIIEAVRRAAQGQTYFSPSITAVAARHVTKTGRRDIQADLLSSREREVLEGMTRGLDFDAIGTEMGISPRTVDIHARNICRKLGLGGLMQLRHYALAEAQASCTAARGGR